MNEVDSIPPRRGNQRAAQAEWERHEANCRAYLATVIGIGALLFALIVQALDGPVERTFLSGLWRAVSPWLTGIGTVAFLICAAIVGWHLYQVKLAHDLVKLEHGQQQMRSKLMEESYALTHHTTLLLKEARTNQDNIKITYGEHGQPKSIEVVRTSVLLEQARIAEQAQIQQAIAARYQLQLEREQREQRKQIAAPASWQPQQRERAPEREQEPELEDEEEIVLDEREAARQSLRQPGRILTFAELLEEGIVQEALKLGFILLGYVGKLLRYGDWMDLYSAGVGGVTGSGKTTTVRFLLFQAILAGAKLLMVDPHIHEPEESLAAQFAMFRNIHLMKPCDDDPTQVAKRIRWFWAEYKRRKAKGIKAPAYIFVLDEFNEIVALLPPEVKKELAELMLRIAQSGRKFGLFVMLIGQRWSEQDLGGKPYGAAIRTSLAAVLAHRFTDQSQAAKLVGGRDASECLSLNQGHFLFRDTNGNLSHTITPDTVSEDGEIIQELLDVFENTVESTVENTENTDEVVISDERLPVDLSSYRAENRAEGAENTRIDTLARQVVQLQAENVQKPEIMRRLWKVNPGGTEAYQQALEEYKQVMAYIARRMGA
jgi:hypothetical protein